jgi:pimeloyl-ACP methyl ester carboxylesterase
MPEITLSQGPIHYRDEGAGPPVVLVHGLLVSGTVWDRLLPALSPHVRCIVPDLPLGSHRLPMSPEADLSPLGLATLVAELIERLGLEGVTLVGNDTGGALAQLVVVEHPEHIGRLMLVNCDAFEHFPPPALAPVIKVLARGPGALAALATLGRLRAMRRMTMSLAPLTVRPIDDAVLQEWVKPLRDRAIRRDLLKVLRGISPELTVRAAERLPGFDRPVVIVWGTEDRFFPLADGERLAALFPDGRLETIEGARTFVQIDAPERLAELVLAAASAGAHNGQGG